MTLKSLNTPHLKLIRKMTVIGVGLFLATVSLLSPTRSCAEATGFNRRPVEADNSIPALQGAAAITYLKERKLYDSLKTALNAARSSVLIDEQKLTASDGVTNAQFGNSVAVSGSTVVVGAQFDTIGSNSFQGSAYIFERQGGSWFEAQKLTASDGTASDIFGVSVAISGSSIVVGAMGVNIGGNRDQGAVYVFNRQGGSWIEMQKLTASDGADGDSFGNSVTMSGSTIVVGAEADDIGAVLNQGSAYVFNRRGASWVETQKLIPSDSAVSVGFGNDLFGHSVAISGSTIVVGALLDTISGNNFQGSAYVFNHQGGSWFEMQKLTGSDSAAFDSFGLSVAVSGPTIVVGALNNRTGNNFDQGAAYVFERHGRSWFETQKLTASDGAALDNFGNSVAFSGSTIVVGALSDDVAGNLDQGSAYVFNRQGGSWVETQKLIASDGAASDTFGRSVAVNGSTIVVGVSLDDIDGNINQGSAYVFEP